MKSMKDLRSFGVPILISIALGSGAFFISQFPAWRKEAEVSWWYSTESNLWGIAQCLEEYRNLLGTYPETLSQIDLCMKDYELTTTDSWGVSLSYQRSGPVEYKLVSCVEGSACWDFASGYFEPWHLENGLEISSGVWIEPSRQGWVNHKIIFDLEEDDQGSLLGVVVKTEFENEQGNEELRQGFGSRGFAVSLKTIGEGEWSINGSELSTDSGWRNIWIEDRTAQWDDLIECEVFEVSCSGSRSQLVIAVFNRGGMERSIADNFGLGICKEGKVELAQARQANSLW